MYTSGFMDDVMFANNGQEYATRKWRVLKLTQQWAAPDGWRNLICTVALLKVEIRLMITRRKGERSIAMSTSVCLSVCPPADLKN